MTSSLRDYGAAAPHGPNMERHHVATQDVSAINPNEAGVLHNLLHPDDIYDENGTYWADLPMRQRLKFVTPRRQPGVEEGTAINRDYVQKRSAKPVGILCPEHGHPWSWSPS